MTHNQNVKSLVPSIQVKIHLNVKKSKIVLNLKSTNTYLAPTIVPTLGSSEAGAHSRVSQNTEGLGAPETPWQHYDNGCCSNVYTLDAGSLFQHKLFISLLSKQHSELVTISWLLN